MSLQSKKSPKKSVERNSCYFYLNFIFSKYGTVLQRIKKKMQQSSAQIDAEGKKYWCRICFHWEKKLKRVEKTILASTI